MYNDMCFNFRLQQTINVVQRVRDNFLRKYTKKDIDDAYKKYSDLVMSNISHMSKMLLYQWGYI